MAAIVLYHTGSPLPEHLFDCVAMIRRQSQDIPIHLITDQADAAKEVRLLDVHLYHSVHRRFRDLERLQNLDYWSDGKATNNLWRSSCFRLWYIQRIMEEKGLKNVLTFDNDVLLFTKPEEIIERASQLYRDFAITAHNEAEVVFGMSFIPDWKCLADLTNWIEWRFKQGWESLKREFHGFPNEMRLISAYPDYSCLPILPYGANRYARDCHHFQGVFDPSSYGQFLGGTANGDGPGWFGVHQEIGQLISIGEIKVVFEDKKPWLIYAGERIPIFNLHVHSKRMEQFL